VARSAGACCLAASTQWSAAAENGLIAQADLDFFEVRIRPVLVENCYDCHSRTADKVKGGLLLDTREGLLHGGNSGPAVVPGNPDASPLIEAVRYTNEDLQMPPEKHGGKLTDAAIADLVAWVQRGAPDPRANAVAGSSSKTYGGVGKDHWAFQPVKKPAVPPVRDAAWARTPVDRFILAKLEAVNLTPNPDADKRTLLRRVTFDLTGLPPTPAEIDAFVADTAPDALAKVVDRLLASPQYGEHWGRYWLDVARYSDTKGDPARRDDLRYPHAWTYRDYVISAFNTDKPFNQFILEQLAADRLLTRPGPSTRANYAGTGAVADQSTLAALGFLNIGNTFDGRRNDVINDQIDVTTKAFLGLTVSCARCHDHKFDPIPTKDYYSLYGVFANSDVPDDLPFVRPVPKTPEFEDYAAQRAGLLKQAEDLQAQFRDMRRARGGRDPEIRRQLIRQVAQLQRAIGDLESNHPGAPPRAMALEDVARPKDYPVLLRGEPENTGEIVPRRFLEILSGAKRPVFKDGSGRLELARAIADPTNPLTARVLVNRVWQQHFGAGFVDTPDDLGNMASAPTHPELLDWLAATFVEQGWSLKKLHRSIVLSRVYQLSSAANAACAAADPDNRLRWRANLRRLDFEQVHDALLAIGGSLDLSQIGGRPVQIASGDFLERRAIYTWIDRGNPPELLTQFDFPNPDVPTGRRYETIVPQQSLFLMNSPLVVESARSLVHHAAFAALKTDEERVASLYVTIFARPPDAREMQLCLEYVRRNPDGTSLEGPATPAQAAGMTRAAERQAERNQRQMRNPRRGNTFQQEPGGAVLTNRAPPDAWTKLAHALFQTNEAMFLN
jgi:hypothetical protein